MKKNAFYKKKIKNKKQIPTKRMTKKYIYIIITSNTFFIFLLCFFLKKNKVKNGQKFKPLIFFIN